MRRLKEGKVHLETHSSLETCEEEKEGALHEGLSQNP
jgi:hypothetical protein